MFYWIKKRSGSWGLFLTVGVILVVLSSVSAAFAGLPVGQSIVGRDPLSPTNPGDLDPTFGTGGKVTTDLFGPTAADAYANAVQPDGKIVLAGSTMATTGMAFGLMRVDSNGSLDASFGREGKIGTDFVSGEDRANAVALQGDGKIVAAGYARSDTGNGFVFAVARYNTDGSLDTGFDGDGKVITHLTNYDDRANAVAIQADGKIVLAGRSSSGPYSFGLVRYNSDGSLDTSFDGDGILVANFSFGSSDEANGLAIQADGKIVAVGRAGNNTGVMRFNSDGSLDTSFDGDGKVITLFQGDSRAYAVLLGADGKILVAGGNGDFTLSRYNANGSLDTSFSGDGLVTTHFGFGLDIAYAVALQPDGKIVATGRADRADDGTQSVTADFGVARYNTDGSLDTTFDGDGLATTYYVPGSLEIARSLVLQPGGKIVAVGYTQVLSPPDYPALLVRYNADGAIDTGFGSGGKLAINGDVSGYNRINAVKIQGDGKIVAAGTLNPVGGSSVSIARYNPDGSLDSGFGTNGKIRANFGAINVQAYALVVQPDGKIVVGGYVYGGGALGEDFLLARYNSDGTPDTGFGTGGRVFTDFDFNNDRARALALQPDGKIVAAGYTFSRFAVARYNTNGTLDTTFGTGGRVTTDFGSGDDIANAVAIQADGKILAGGSTVIGGDLNFALARYDANGNLDTSFGGTGKVTTSISFGDKVNDIQIQADAMIVAAGATGSDFGLARYTTIGELDSNFGGGGIVTTDFGGFEDAATGLGIQSDGKLLAGGYAFVSGSYDFALSRYNTNGIPDGSFGAAGKVTTSFGGGEDRANALAIQNADRVVLGGFTDNNGDFDFALARYLTSNIVPETSTPTRTATTAPTSTSTSTSIPPSATRTSTPSPTHTATLAVASATVTTLPNSTSSATMQAATATATSQITVVATSTPCTITFTDVAPDSTFYSFIRCLACRGIISGYSDGTFKPGNEITRSQIAKMVSNAAGFSEGAGEQIYEDVPAGNTFYVWINRLSRRGYMGGYPCGSVPEEPCVSPDNRPYFRPFANATRGQLAKIVSNAAGITGTPSGLFYTDVPEDNPFYVWVMRLTQLGVMSGYPCGRPDEPCDEQNRPYFRPYANVTRGQASKIVANTFYPNCQTPSRR